MQLLKTVIASLIFLVALPVVAQSVQLEPAQQSVLRGTVVSVGTTTETSIAGTDTLGEIQEITVRLEDGSEVSFENDYLPVEAGDRIFVNRLVGFEGDVIYGVKDVVRLPVLSMLGGAFALFVLLFARWSGLRALASVAVSFVVIIYILLPLLLAGYSPVLVSFAVAALILAVAIFGTHGFNKVSYAALASTVLSVVVSGILAKLVIAAASFTGFSSDESIYLNFNTSGSLDFTGLLLGAIVIGMLGVLDDIAITQASLVEELHISMPTASKQELYARAMKVGRDHVQALINTLFLAYTGASLPLLLLLKTTSDTLSLTLNQEVIAVEIVRTIIGSLGLILAVPLSTRIALHLFKK